jgi:UDP-N-acetylmuramoylalanine--D-glutamate ligase
MEFSSFQLELVTTSPHIAAVLNITPNHLDRHGSMQAYIDAKARILQHQEPSDIAVLGRDNPAALGLARETKAGAVWLFSLGDRPQPGAYLEGDVLALAYPDAGPQAVCRRSAVKLRGAHNLLNVLAACAIAGAASVPVDAMRAAIESFEGVPHRLEPVARVKDVLWVNDSIATAPERVVAALRSFDEPLVLLAGGRDKDLPWQQFAAEAAGRVRHLICFGEAGAMIAQHVSFAWMRVGEESALEKVEVVEDLPAAVVRAAASARPGELVLLSPGGTSYDAYRDFEERGEHFRDLVRELAGE